jgi:hypothetical protein
MEIRQNVTRVPKQSIMLLAATLFVLALGLLGWRALAIGAVTPTVVDRPTAATNVQTPDAKERNAQILFDRIKNEFPALTGSGAPINDDTTHGH